MNFVKFLRGPFLQNTSGRLLLQLLNETHLHVVKDLIQLKGFNQYINNKSSLERCYYIRTEQADISYANAKKLLQSAKTYIGVAFISLVPFRHLSFLDRGQLISYIYIYYPFAGTIYHIVFYLVCQRLEFRLWGWNMAFLGRRLRNLAEVFWIILTTQDDWPVLLSMLQAPLQMEEAFTVKEYKHTHIHLPPLTHKYTHTRR